MTTLELLKLWFKLKIVDMVIGSIITIIGTLIFVLVLCSILK